MICNFLYYYFFWNRDREVEITTIEEARHKLREKEYGKNYLLETYLKGLRDFEEKESATGNSDSGVHTEEATTSPEVAASPQLPEDNQHVPEPKQEKMRRNLDLRNLSLEEGAVGGDNYHIDTEEEEIQLLEKIVTINKQLIKEEEQLVKLNAKLKKYQCSPKEMTQDQILVAIQKINEQLQRGNDDLEEVDDAIIATDDLLQEKTTLLSCLYEECERVQTHESQLNHDPTLLDYNAKTQNYNPVSRDYYDGQQPIPQNQNLDQQNHNLSTLINGANLNLSREYLADNIYNVSKTILQSTQPTIPEAELSDMFVYPIQPPSQFCSPYDPENVPVEAQVLNLNDTGTFTATPIVIPPPATFNHNDFVNYFEKHNQRNMNNVMAATSLKLGPKKLINGIVMQQSNSTSNSSDTGLSLTSDPDFNQFSTLVWFA